VSRRDPRAAGPRAVALSIDKPLCHCEASRLGRNDIDPVTARPAVWAEAVSSGLVGDRFVARKLRSLLAMTGHMSFRREWSGGHGLTRNDRPSNSMPRVRLRLDKGDQAV
jgi:hypothetical protein